MARTSQPPAPPPKPTLDAAQIQKGIERLEQRIADLDAFDLNTLVGSTSPELQALECSIEDTLERYFGANTASGIRYRGACQLHSHSRVWMSGMATPNYKEETGKYIRKSKALLGQAILSLKADLEDLSPAVSTQVSKTRSAVHSSRVFLVHGHDEAVRETVARFLEKIGIEVIILHEQANRGRTIIEKIEYNSDVGMAVVLLTPDDVCGESDGPKTYRVRQNVLIELGYFIGALGRDKVCVLRYGNVEIPSDFAGVVWTEMSGEWKTALARELKGAGYEVDSDRFMS